MTGLAVLTGPSDNLIDQAFNKGEVLFLRKDFRNDFSSGSTRSVGRLLEFAGLPIADLALVTFSCFQKCGFGVKS